jgi:hypothetical protein
LALLPELTGEAAAAATQAAMLATTGATAAPSALTPEQATPEITSGAESVSDSSIEVAILSLSAYTLAPNGMGVEQTSLGNALVANVCTVEGPELRSTLPAVMDTLARQPLTMPLDAIGTRLTDCDQNTTLRVIVVPYADAQAYAAGSLSEEEFQARWRSL